MQTQPIFELATLFFAANPGEVLVDSTNDNAFYLPKLLKLADNEIGSVEPGKFAVDLVDPSLSMHNYGEAQRGSWWIEDGNGFQLPVDAVRARVAGLKDRGIYTRDTAVFFWGASSPYSNFHPQPYRVLEDEHLLGFDYSNIIFKFVEQEMMFNKALLMRDRKTADKILKVDHPGEAKRLGREVRGFDKDLWEQNARTIVFYARLKQAAQSPSILAQFKNDAGKSFVEASPYDVVWGIGLPYTDHNVQFKSRWKGTNWLGEVNDLLSLAVNSGKLQEVLSGFFDIAGESQYHDQNEPWRYVQSAVRQLCLPS